MENTCPNHPEQELESAHACDAPAGDVYIEVWCYYCPKCLYVTDTEIQVYH